MKFVTQPGRVAQIVALTLRLQPLDEGDMAALAPIMEACTNALVPAAEKRGDTVVPALGGRDVPGALDVLVSIGGRASSHGRCHKTRPV